MLYMAFSYCDVSVTHREYKNPSYKMCRRTFLFSIKNCMFTINFFLYRDNFIMVCTMYRNTITVLKHKQNYVGLMHKNKPYIVGFHKDTHAKYILNNIDLHRPITLDNENCMNVIDIVNKSLDFRNIPLVNSSKIVIDTSAILSVPTKSCNDDILESYEMHFQEFIMKPFEQNIGIVMPFDISSLLDNKCVFNAEVIDPVDDLSRFIIKMS